jgi:hypothetical protein
MDSQPSRPADGHIEPLTAERICSLIVLALAEHPEVVSCRPAATIYIDRLALSVEDHARQLWRIHVLAEARR